MYYLSGTPECQDAWYQQLVTGIADSLRDGSGYVIDDTKALDSIVAECIGPVGDGVFKLFITALRGGVDTTKEFVRNRLEGLGYKSTGLGELLGGWPLQYSTWQAWVNLLAKLEACPASPGVVPPPLPEPAPAPRPAPEPASAPLQAGVPWFWLVAVGVVMYVWGHHS